MSERRNKVQDPYLEFAQKSTMEQKRRAVVLATDTFVPVWEASAIPNDTIERLRTELHKVPEKIHECQARCNQCLTKKSKNVANKSLEASQMNLGNSLRAADHLRAGSGEPKIIELATNNLYKGTAWEME